MHEAESAIRALRSCEQESTGKPVPCAGCCHGICRAAFAACELPEPEPDRRSLIQIAAGFLRRIFT